MIDYRTITAWARKGRQRGRRGKLVSMRRVASGTALTLIASLLVVMAVHADGFPISKVDLNDGSVWVTKDASGIMGRLNSQVKELDLGVLTRSGDTALYQQASNVEVMDLGGGGARRAMITDVAAGAIKTSVDLPKTVDSSAATTTVGLLDSVTGKAWVRTGSTLNGFTEKDTPLLTVGSKGAVVVGADGTTYFLDRARKRVVPVTIDDTGVLKVGEAIDIGAELSDHVAMTVVDGKPVVLDQDTSVVYFAGGKHVTLDDGKSPVLQQPVGDDATRRVHVATTTGLFAIDLDGTNLTKVSTVDVSGDPAAPAVVAGCTYGAWIDPGRDNFEQICGDKHQTDRIPQLSQNAELIFRTNRKVVVLNDAIGGNAWIVQASGLQLVNNWDSIDPRKKQEEKQTKKRKERDKNKNHPPKAVDDKFGARPGSTVVLPVTLNDQDEDGDVLTVSPDSVHGDGGATYSVVGNGTQIQARIGSNASGTVHFTYEVTDGHAENPSSQADVEVAVHGGSLDTAPKLLPNRTNELTVARGHQATLNVIPSWIDPEGDTVVLTKASSKGGTVNFRPDGTISFLDNGDGHAEKTIDFTLQGGSKTKDAKALVTVEDPAKAAPMALADRVSGVAGSAILAEPLTNDTDPLGGHMTLQSVKKVSGGSVDYSFDADKGSVTVQAQRAGTYYLEYVAGNGSAKSSAPELVRVDVLSSTGRNRPPVAAKDTATLPSGGSALVDVLANDSDPDGDVLVVQGLDLPADSPLKASLIDKRFVRIEAASPLDGKQAALTYHLSDGTNGIVNGTVTVSEGTFGENRPPVPQPDLVTARAGSIITIPVLDNDSDPDGDKLTVDQQDLIDPPKDVPVVATGAAIRIMVPDDGRSELELGYGVRDSSQALASSSVVLNITPKPRPGHAEDNHAPRPQPIEDRTVSGDKIRIPISAFGADPDGDPIAFKSVSQAPALGRIVATGVDWIDYQPFPDASGTDAFKVKVTDPYGAAGTVDVRVGVAPPDKVNQPPSALDDQLFVRPGRTIQYPVRDNDSDPDGDLFRLSSDVQAAPGVEAKVVGDFVQMKVPSLGGESEVVQSAQYEVSDGLGGTSSAKLVVTARDDAPLHAPIANDDDADLDKVAGKKAGDTVDIDVLKNDGDIDGPKSALRVTAMGKSALVGHKLRITLTPKDQVVPYRLTDDGGHGEASYGFVYVSGTELIPPVLNSDAVPIKVTAGQVKTIDLADVVRVRQGHRPTILRRDQVLVSHGDGSDSSKDDRTLVFRAPKTYNGPASMTLDVTDGNGLNDPKALTSQIMVPIDVRPAVNVAPVVRSTEVGVAAGGDSTDVDLKKLARDANGDDLHFSVKGAAHSVSGKVDGDVLKVSASGDATIGDTVVLTVLADDGKSKTPGSGEVRARVVSSTRPMMQIQTIGVPDGKAGQPVSRDVKDFIISDPYPKGKKKVSSPEVVRGEVAGAPKIEGTKVTVTPAKGFSGEVVLSLRVSDGSGDPKRDVGARMEVTVADKPDRPAAPTASEAGPDSVNVSWTAPRDNGKPITEYRVSWNGGKKSCSSTRCVVDGLDPGQEYRFTVAAKNAVDWSDESPKSSAVKPDKVPDRMNAPTIDPSTTFPARNQKLDVSWAKPNNVGSDIVKYEVEVSPGQVKTFSASTLSSPFAGLANGTAYRFRARAVNARGEGPWSNWSTTEVPFTKPGGVATPVLTVDPPGFDGQGHVSATWGSPSDDGDDPDGIKQYDVELVKDGSTSDSATPGGGSTGVSFAVDNGHEYKVRVRPVNKAGEGPWVESNAEIAYDKSTAPTNLHQVGDDGDKTGTLAFTTPSNDGGYPVTKYAYETQDGHSATVSAPTSAKGASTQITIAFNANHNDAQWVQLTPITQPPGKGDVAGQGAKSGALFRPFGTPGAPGQTQNSSGYREATVGWNGGTANGRPIEKTEYQGAASGTTGASGGSKTIGTAQGGDSVCIQARSYAAGKWSAWSANLCASAQARSVTVGHGSPYNSGYYVKTTLAGYKANTTYTLHPYQNGDPDWCGDPAASAGCQNTKNVTTDGDGRATYTGYWWCGYSNVTVTVKVSDGTEGSTRW